MASKPGIVLDKRMFTENVERFCKHFRANPSLYGNATALSVEYGGVDAEPGATALAAAFQLFLLTYEFPDTVVIVTATSVTFLTSSKKTKYLEPVALECNKTPFKAHIIDRSGDDSGTFTQLLATINSSGADVKLGRVEAGVTTTPFITAWRARVAAAGLPVVDASRGVDAAFSLKNKVEIGHIQTAAKLTSRLYRKVMLPAIESAMESDKKVKQSSITEKMDKALDNLEKYGIKVEASLCLYMLTPVVQSGGKYDLDIVHVKPTDDILKYDTMVVSAGGRFKSFGSAVARTYLVDPSSLQKKAYQALLDVQQFVFDGLKPGEKISTVVRRAKDKIDAKSASYVEGFVAGLLPTFGSGIGLMPKESSLELREGNDTVIRAGMVFNVCVGVKDLRFADCPSPSTKYSMLIADTIEITDGEQPYSNATLDIPKELREIVYLVGEEAEAEDEDEDEAPQKKKSSKSDRAAAAAADALGRADGYRSARLREAAAAGGLSEVETKQREDKVRDLLRKQCAEMLAQMGRGQGHDESGNVLEAKDFEAYKSTSDFPPEIKPNQLFVDRNAETLLVPIAGSHVPFHISTIKSVSKSEDGPITFLRINFYAPGTAAGKDVSPSMLKAMAENPDSMYIRMINLKSKDPKNINFQLRLIKDIQKRIRGAHFEEREHIDVVVQPDLMVQKGVRVPVLPDVMMFPHMSGRKSEGVLEAHANGFRFLSNKGEKFDIIYSNVKHAIFQPCDKEHEVLIHFHLKTPLMVGKKKHYDVQFYTEVIEASQALDRAKSGYDPDELEEEAQERRRRQLLNKQFKKYVEQVQDIVSRVKGSFHEFDIPSRDISFTGQPFKENVTLLPCTTCLVSLTDRPPFLLTLDDIEHVHFERVAFSSKSFDMVVIMKPGTMPKGSDEYYRISVIPMNKLDTVKMWLVDVLGKGYTEGAQPLNWKQMLKDYVRKPDFYLDTSADTGEPKEAGWEALFGSDEDEEGGDEEDESEFEEESVESEEGSDDDDDEEFSDAVDDEDEDDDDEDASAGSEDSSGLDWDEMEERAAEDDKKRVRHEEDSEDEKRKPKKKRK